VAGLGRGANAADAHERAAAAGQDAGLAIADAGPAGPAAARVPVVGGAVAVVVEPVADLRRGPDRADARAVPRGAHRAGLDARPALADVAAARPGDAVDDAVTVVVAAVADFGGGTGSGARAPHAGDAGLGAGGAVAEVGAAGAHEPLVDEPVAVVVRAVARLGQARRADVAFVDRAVAVVVDAVADVGRWRAAGPAGVAQAFVDLAVAVVVDAIADRLARIDAELRRRDAAPDVAVEREALVDEAVAVVVRAVARLDEDRVVHDLAEGRRERGRVVGEDRLGRVARRRDRVEVGAVGRVVGGEADDVGREAGAGEGPRRGDRIAPAGLVAVGDQDHAVGAAARGRVERPCRLEEAERGGEAPGDRRRAAAAQLDVEPGRRSAGVVRLPVHPLEQVVLVVRAEA